jgi:ribosomal protein S18 acetylase RimI-like enzyme
MVPKPIPTVVRPVTEGDRQQLANLIHFQTLVHRHLDWRPPLDWIGQQPFLLVERNHLLLSALACPPDPPGVAWIRLFVVSSGMQVGRAWDQLWPAARAQLIREAKATVVAVIPLQRWFRSLLDSSEFLFTHNVMVLAWTSRDMPPVEKGSSARIRLMKPDDLAEVQKVDQEAFTPVWQNSYSGLELAYQQSAISTVAEISGRIVGYQISTATAMGGHLARLAVQPNFQGKGIGYDLVRDLLIQFNQRGAYHVSVNTQYDNSVSLSLYAKVGFKPTGEEYPVYQLSLK